MQPESPRFQRCVMSIITQLPGYDAWKLHNGESRFERDCPTCFASHKHPEFHDCAQCGRVVCDQCRVDCEGCPAILCDECAEVIESGAYCPECLQVALRDEEEAELAAGKIPLYMRVFGVVPRHVGGAA